MPKLPRRKTPDFAAEGMLRGLRGRKRAARLELLEHLYRQGVPLEELKQAIAEDRLALLPAERVLADKKKYTAAQVIKRAGIELELFVDQRRAAGLPRGAGGRGGLLRRRRGGCAQAQGRRSRRAWIETRCWRGRVRSGRRPRRRPRRRGRWWASRSFAPATPSTTSACAYAEAARRLQPQTVKTLQYLYETHLREQVRSDVVAGADLAAGTLAGTRQVAVCFADLVGFTKLGEQVRAGGPGSGGEALSGARLRRRAAAGVADQDDRRRRDAGLPGARAVAARRR